MTLLWILIATLLVGLISFVGIFFVVAKQDVNKLTVYFMSFASGSMLGSAFLHLIPETLEYNPQHALARIGAGVFLFFLLEKLLIWRHCHTHQHPNDHHRPIAASMVVTGDVIHNFIDGAIIASAFLAGPAVGISITTAIILHEIPQELGDFGVLIHGGCEPKKALLINGLAGTSAIVGALLTYVFIESMPLLQAYVLPLAAGGFLYIALADLIPQLHERVELKETFGQITLLALGAGLISLFKHGAGH